MVLWSNAWVRGGFKRQIGAGACVGDLRVRDDAKDRRNVTTPSGCSSRPQDWLLEKSTRPPPPRLTELVGGLIVDAAAVVRALVPVLVALIGATEGEEVVALQHRDVVAKEVILTIPETGADILGVHVVRSENRRAGLAKRLEGATELGELRNTAGIVPGPVVAEVAEVEIVCGMGGNVGGQSSHEEPGLLRTHSQRARRAQCVAREKASDIYLTGSRKSQFVVAVAGSEMPF